MATSGIDLDFIEPSVGTLDYPKANLKMWVTNPIEADYRIGACKKEPWTVDFIEAIPTNGWFIDVGANVGSYTLVALAKGDISVVAIEPGFPNYHQLCRNLALNGLLAKALCLQIALGDMNGYTWLKYSDMRPGASFLRTTPDPRKEAWHQQLVLQWTMDNLLSGFTYEPGARLFIKMDVDGTEMAILKGATATLQNPILQGMMIEMQRPEEDAIRNYLHQSGWILKERFDQRDGKQIANIVYGQFERV